jgi:NAD(P)-dependent dehydrogenase (short-subunit alcohol dehydrogenase family)
MNRDLTTDDVLLGLDLGDMDALVTGAAGGLGRETARALAAHGARVTVAARDHASAKRVAAEIAAETGNPGVDALGCDLASLASVREAALRFAETHPRLSLLVNNAGVMACPLAHSADGHELQFAVCHLGHFLLTCLLVPRLLAGAPARIVNLSSAGHKLSPVDFDDPDFRRRRYDKWVAYGQAKTANILFSVALQARLGARGVLACAVHPGAIAETALGRHLQPDDIKALLARRDGGPGLRYKGLKQGAATSVWAAVTPELATRGGLYLENCAIAEVNDDPAFAEGGYRSHAADTGSAERLWQLSEEWVGQRFRWDADA